MVIPSDSLDLNFIRYWSFTRTDSVPFLSPPNTS